jgi:uncharacterized protein (DUF362 family)
MVARPGEVVQVVRPGATKGRDTVVPEVATAMLDEALMRFTGRPDPVAALREYIHPEDVVGLKVNALAGPGHAFHPALAWHLAGLLQRLGVPPGRIIIYDQYGDRMRKGGYALRAKEGEVRVLHHGHLGYETREVRLDEARALRWARTLGQVTAVLDLCLPKDHDLAGVTGALKNMAFGNVDHVPEFHRVIHDAIVWVYSQPEIRDKVRLCVCDATRVLYNGGPQDKPRWRVPADSILVSEDPVAMDWAILELVNAERRAHGMPGIEQRERPERRPAFLHRAVGAGLGASFASLVWTRVDAAGKARRYLPGFVDVEWARTPTP